MSPSCRNAEQAIPLGLSLVGFGRTISLRLVGAVLAEQHDEWAEMCRYVSLDILKQFRMRLVENAGTADTTTEVATTALSA